jgi:hypothetical protein
LSHSICIPNFLKDEGYIYLKTIYSSGNVSPVLFNISLVVERGLFKIIKIQKSSYSIEDIFSEEVHSEFHGLHVVLGDLSVVLIQIIDVVFLDVVISVSYSVHLF